MDITQFLQSRGYSRRHIIELLQRDCIRHNGESCAYRKTPVAVWDTIVLPDDSDGTQTLTVTEGSKTAHLYLYNKPIGVVVSQNDPHNETIFTTALNSKPLPKWLYPIGRLDKDSHGLLLLSDTPSLVSALAHPRYDHEKVYHVTLHALFTKDDIAKGIAGVPFVDPDTGEKMVLSRKECVLIQGNTYRITLTSWKKRHIRRLCSQLQQHVDDLQRVRFSQWSLPDDLEAGGWRVLTLSSWDLQNLLDSQNSYTLTQT
jgi:pseudouridine synthase